VWDELTVPIKYGSDRKLAHDILLRAANEVIGEYTIGAAEYWKHMLRRYKVENARVDPMVTMIANDNWMPFTVRYVVDYKKRRSTMDLIFRRILDEVDKTDGKVQLSSSTSEIVELPELSIKLLRGAKQTPEIRTEGRILNFLF